MSHQRHKSKPPAKPRRRRVLNPADVPRHLGIHALAHRVFGEREKAEAWLSKPNAVFNGQAPADLLKDELGAAVVREAPEQIDHGIFA